MDMGSKEVLMESPPVSVGVWVLVRVYTGPISLSRFICSTSLGLG